MCIVVEGETAPPLQSRIPAAGIATTTASCPACSRDRHGANKAVPWLADAFGTKGPSVEVWILLCLQATSMRNDGARCVPVPRHPASDTRGIAAVNFPLCDWANAPRTKARPCGNANANPGLQGKAQAARPCKVASRLPRTCNGAPHDVGVVSAMKCGMRRIATHVFSSLLASHSRTRRSQRRAGGPTVDHCERGGVQAL